MSKIDNLKKLAVVTAVNSSSPIRVGAVLSKRNERVAACNLMDKTHPNSVLNLNSSSKRTRYRRVHAEQRVLIKGRSFTDDSVLVVARVRKDGSLALARPCEEICMPLILEANIKKIIYSISNGDWGTLLVREYLGVANISS